MKNNFIFKLAISILFLILIGCNKLEKNEVVNSFNDVSLNLTKRIEFSNLTIISDEKELGRSKIVTDESDIKS